MTIFRICSGTELVMVIGNLQFLFQSSSDCIDQSFPTRGKRTPRGTQGHRRGYAELFNTWFIYESHNLFLCGKCNSTLYYFLVYYLIRQNIIYYVHFNLEKLQNYFVYSEVDI